MADSITISLPDNTKGNRVWKAIAATQGYQEEIEDGSGNMIPNPQNKKGFAKDWICRTLKNIVIQYEGSVAGKIARDEAEALVVTEIILT